MYLFGINGLSEHWEGRQVALSGRDRTQREHTERQGRVRKSQVCRNYNWPTGQWRKRTVNLNFASEMKSPRWCLLSAVCSFCQRTMRSCCWTALQPPARAAAPPPAAPPPPRLTGAPRWVFKIVSVGIPTYDLFLAFFIKLIWLGVGFLNRTGA